MEYYFFEKRRKLFLVITYVLYKLQKRENLVLIFEKKFKMLILITKLKFLVI